jgi:hypothetical protein
LTAPPKLWAGIAYLSIAINKACSFFILVLFSKIFK